MSLRRYAVLAAALLAVPILTCGAASAAKTYPDRVGDVEGGAGPDIANVYLSHTKTKLTFSVRFAKAPPLRINPREGWIDMLLIGIDVPPLGPRPILPNGEWRGADYGVGTHGPFKTGQMVRLGDKVPLESRSIARFTILTNGSTLSFSIPRRALGNPTWFAFTVAAAREGVKEGAAAGGVDYAPVRGTLRYALTG